MPDSRQHRGPHPEDAQQFAASFQTVLQRATSHLSWLLSRDYAVNSALKVVGDRFQLTRRQRLAVLRSACSDAARSDRAERQVLAEDLQGEPLEIDAFNVLTTIESALSGGVLIQGRDGCCRDMASMHGSYRRVAETRPALELIGDQLQRWGVGSSVWWLDRPVSNSGRLSQMIELIAAEHHWPWEARLAGDVDRKLIAASSIIASADSVVIGRADKWFNLAATLISLRLPHITPLKLGVEATAETGE